MTETEDRLARLESQLEQQRDRIDDQQDTIEEQQATIEAQRERIADLQNDGTAATETESTVLNRRNALKAGGFLALLFGSTGTASADSQGQVGTSGDPLKSLYTEELNGGVTGDTALTNLTGTGLSISDGSLGTTREETWQEADSDGLLEPSSGYTGIDVSDVWTDNLRVGRSNVQKLDGAGLTLADGELRVRAGNGLEFFEGPTLGGGSKRLEIKPSEIDHDQLKNADSGASDHDHTNISPVPVAGLDTPFTALADVFDSDPVTVGGNGNLDVDQITSSSTDNLLEIGDGAERIRVNSNIDISGSVIKNLVPDDGETLGSDGDRWGNIYLQDGPNTASDARLKQNITDLSDGLERLSEIHPVSYEWNDEDSPDTRLGFIAQELEEAVPEAVNHPDDEGGYLGVTYEMVLPVAVAAIQKQQDRIEELEAENDRLRERVAAIEERLGVDAGGGQEAPADD
jgi:uncharacterized coiled-coil protein SlyX